MLHPQFILPIAHELVVDLFAGGGGASTGIEQAIGRHVDIAINHDPEAVSLHEATLRPRFAPSAKPTGPSCTPTPSSAP